MLERLLKFARRSRRPEPNARLIRRMAAGDLDALTELHRRLGNTVYAVAYRILTEPDEAGRVVSETFADVWREAGGFDAKESRVDRWLVQTARTKAQARVLILDRI